MAQQQSFDTYRVSDNFWIQIAPLLPEYRISPLGGRPGPIFATSWMLSVIV